MVHACNAYTQTAIYDADYRKLAPKVTKKKDLTQPSLKKLSSFFFQMSDNVKTLCDCVQEEVFREVIKKRRKRRSWLQSKPLLAKIKARLLNKMAGFCYSNTSQTPFFSANPRTPLVDGSFVVRWSRRNLERWICFWVVLRDFRRWKNNCARRAIWARKFLMIIDTASQKSWQRSGRQICKVTCNCV